MDHEYHEWNESHERTSFILSFPFIPTKAGIHARITSYTDIFLKITVKIHDFEKE